MLFPPSHPPPPHVHITFLPFPSPLPSFPSRLHRPDLVSCSGAKRIPHSLRRTVERERNRGREREKEREGGGIASLVVLSLFLFPSSSYKPKCSIPFSLFFNHPNFSHVPTLSIYLHQLPCIIVLFRFSFQTIFIDHLMASVTDTADFWIHLLDIHGTRTVGLPMVLLRLVDKRMILLRFGRPGGRAPQHENNLYTLYQFPWGRNTGGRNGLKRCDATRSLNFVWDILSWWKKDTCDLAYFVIWPGLWRIARYYRKLPKNQ